MYILVNLILDWITKKIIPTKSKQLLDEPSFDSQLHKFLPIVFIHIIHRIVVDNSVSIYLIYSTEKL